MWCFIKKNYTYKVSYSNGVINSRFCTQKMLNIEVVSLKRSYTHKELHPVGVALKLVLYNSLKLNILHRYVFYVLIHHNIKKYFTIIFIFVW